MVVWEEMAEGMRHSSATIRHTYDEGGLGLLGGRLVDLLSKPRPKPSKPSKAARGNQNEHKWL
jgi:hypothetical protein